jgi:hypothetical protein
MLNGSMTDIINDDTNGQPSHTQQEFVRSEVSRGREF